jgi:hypothetical protein
MNEHDHRAIRDIAGSSRPFVGLAALALVKFQIPFILLLFAFLQFLTER